MTPPLALKKIRGSHDLKIQVQRIRTLELLQVSGEETAIPEPIPTHELGSSVTPHCAHVVMMEMEPFRNWTERYRQAADFGAME